MAVRSMMSPPQKFKSYEMKEPTPMPAEQDAKVQIREHRLDRASREWLVDRIEALEAELLAAQERAKRLREERDRLRFEGYRAQEREKALRQWIKSISFNEQLPKALRNDAAAILWNTNLEALAPGVATTSSDEEASGEGNESELGAASPSEKPGSEEREPGKFRLDHSGHVYLKDSDAD